MAIPTVITSRDNARVRRVCRLLDDTAARAEEGCFAAESAKLCIDLAAVCPPEEVYFTKEALERTPELDTLAGEHFLLQQHVAQKLARTRTTQGVWAVFRRPASPAALRGRRLLALDGVQDPGNLGAVLRSAAAFGWQGVLLGPGCADPYSPKALRAGMSSTLKLPLLITWDLAGQLKALRGRGWQCMAARLQDSEELPVVSPDALLVLVVGSEGRGISPEVDAICDKGVRIPIAPSMESLNAAVAASVLMWHYR